MSQLYWHGGVRALRETAHRTDGFSRRTSCTPQNDANSVSEDVGLPGVRRTDLQRGELL